MISEDKAMVSSFNQFFSGVFTRENTANLPELQEQHQGDFLCDVQITVMKVKRKIQKLRKGAAAGPDKIGPRLLQELVYVVAGPLTTVMRKSLESGEVPED